MDEFLYIDSVPYSCGFEMSVFRLTLLVLSIRLSTSCLSKSAETLAEDSSEMTLLQDSSVALPVDDTGETSVEPASEPAGEPAGEPSNEDSGLASDGIINIAPSYGSGGAWGPGEVGRTDLGSDIRIPNAYAPASMASPVVWLFNEQIDEWVHTDSDSVIIVDLREYNDIPAIVDKINESMSLLERSYNVDQGRYYFAGWSAGGNIAVILSAMNQDLVAGTMVFPGTGGNQALTYMQEPQPHQISLFYACGDQDPNFAWDVVEYEANYWASAFGYETEFVRVEGGPHKLLESEYGIRAQAWAWMRGFNMEN